MKLTIFTDGSSRGNPGPGGWGTVVVIQEKGIDGSQGRIVELGGGEKRTTNNKMELMAAAKALSFVAKQNLASDVSIDVYTDSAYLINGITKWIVGWKRNGWKTKTKDDVLNKEVWLDIDHALGLIMPKIKWHHVGGHVGIVGNERCDEIATAFADGFENSDEKVRLYDGTIAGYNINNILDISHDVELALVKKASSSRSNAKAYSYVSRVDGVIQVHKTWAECEKKVKGMRGARFKKALSIGEEAEIIKSFQS